MKRNEIAVLIGVIIVMGALGLWAINNDQSISTPQCLLNDTACTVNGLIIDITPRPIHAMTDLVFSVTLSDPLIKTDNSPLALKLEMPGMQMGVNRIKLKKISDIRYSGKGVIPACPSGKKNWMAIVTDLSIRELARISFAVE